MDGIPFSKAVDGYFLYAHSRRLSKHTISDYRYTFRRFQRFLAPEDPPIDEITLDVFEAFFAGLNGLSKKTVLNYHTGLSALWTWAKKRGIVDEHVVRRFDPPKPRQPVIEVFTEEELQKLLNACGRSETYKRPGKRRCSNRRPTALRDKAIILTLLDSMVRVSELCAMRRSDTNPKDGRVKVVGKGDKERWVPISPETSQVIWQYVASRDAAKPRFADYVYLTAQGRPMSWDGVGLLLRRIGRRVDVKANPHKFRHTGATMFLRNGGNAFV
jgi:integrase/recombinase XerC/integrase/recombinase XerD